MAREVLAEAVLSNILYFIHTTKHIRQGSAIACRNFLMSVCFHKHKFPPQAHSSRKISQLTKIHRNTLLSHMKSKQCLKDIRYKPFAKGSASNFWGNRAVSFGVNCFQFVRNYRSTYNVPSVKCRYQNVLVCKQGGAIVLKEVNTHWSDNLIPSPNKKDLVFQHVKGPGMHVYIQQPNGGKKYVCSEGAQCKSHQRHFMKNTTTALYKHFLQQYPLRRGIDQIAFFL